ncbi:MAG: NTP transferase domain-containing protein [Anaerolineae bacterium]|jgi:molybdenum cofactor cytidylyltransferase|nr:NTP transferase domain-containing protein [Anaerolineae bacterium]
MGAFKLTLPWRETTVIETVVGTLERAALAEIVVVTGHRAAEVQERLAGSAARCALNPRYEDGGMLSSIQTGLSDIATRRIPIQAPGVDAAPQIAAALMCLGDQPQMELATVEAVLAEGERTGWQRVIIPSYRMRAGHPILIPSSLWPQIMNTSETLRATLRAREDLIIYLEFDTDSVLADLDTPEDYARATNAQEGQ